MADNGIFMDLEAVRGMAKNFGVVGNVLKGVSMALEAAMLVLKTTAFIGLVGGFAVERYIASIKPQIDRLAEMCEELNGDLDKSAAAYENGDQVGSTRFY
ncbi:MAG: type VII secretion target [Chloroflexota bacterium]